MFTPLLVQQYRDVTVVHFQKTEVLDAANIEAIGMELLVLVEREHRVKLILDFTQVKFLSSLTLGVLMQLHRVLQREAGVMVLSGLRPELFRVFKLTNMHRIFDFFDTSDQALAHFGILIPKPEE